MSDSATPPHYDSIPYLDDVVLVYRLDDIQRLWHLVRGSTPRRALGSTLVSYALSFGVDLPDPSMLGSVPAILGHPDCDPWAWTLAQLGVPDNDVQILNSLHHTVFLCRLPSNRLDVRRFLRPSGLSHSICTITVHLAQPHRNLLPTSSTSLPTLSDILQYVRITAPGTVLGPVPGGAPLCTVAETQLIGHRLVFEWTRSADDPAIIAACSVDTVEDALNSLSDLFIYLIAPGMALDSADDVTRVIVHLDTSVHLSQSYHRLVGARP
ncbi:hypothetical protein A4X09_0g7707 [Tilletia walkeri]|uniref:Uncharacterized protein n=1 Tax=Tilletia walkeri TaxID=117179 RepID=A0A8X7N095_9BASI|nr:hypothetical protein A4X09_0g7707 [Tilletia walkeri]